RTFGRARRTFGRARRTFGRARRTFGRARRTFGRARRTFGRARRTFGRVYGFRVKRRIVGWANELSPACVAGLDRNDLVEPKRATGSTQGLSPTQPDNLGCIPPRTHPACGEPTHPVARVKVPTPSTRSGQRTETVQKPNKTPSLGGLAIPHRPLAPRLLIASQTVQRLARASRPAENVSQNKGSS
ncbi:MAG: hypothetical protein RL153_1694, partial [Verrucomicrobiota bacterium]